MRIIASPLPFIQHGNTCSHEVPYPAWYSGTRRQRQPACSAWDGPSSPPWSDLPTDLLWRWPYRAVFPGDGPALTGILVSGRSPLVFSVYPSWSRPPLRSGRESRVRPGAVTSRRQPARLGADPGGRPPSSVSPIWRRTASSVGRPQARFSNESPRTTSRHSTTPGHGAAPLAVVHPRLQRQCEPEIVGTPDGHVAPWMEANWRRSDGNTSLVRSGRSVRTHGRRWLVSCATDGAKASEEASAPAGRDFARSSRAHVRHRLFEASGPLHRPNARPSNPRLHREESHQSLRRLQSTHQRSNRPRPPLRQRQRQIVPVRRVAILRASSIR